MQTFKQTVNPFWNPTGNFKNPAEYLEKVDVGINLIEGRSRISELTMQRNSCTTSCKSDKETL